METFERIEGLCKKRGVSVSALESAIGFSRGSLGKMKKGHMPTPGRLQRVARYFGVTVDYLLTGQETPTKAATAAAEPRFNRHVWELLVQAEKATADDVDAATALLKRFNSIRGKSED